LIYCEYLKSSPIKLSNTNDRQDNIDGLGLINDFLNIEEEIELVESIEGDTTNNWSIVQNRFVKHYGYKFDYNTNSFSSSNNEMPTWSTNLLQKLYEVTGDSEVISMDQLTVSKYPKGTGIPPHVDAHTPFGHTILSISLLSSTQMEFSNPKTKLQYSKMLNPRSALVMSGESRYGWEHCIKERKFDLNEKGELVDRGERISLTYRRTNPTLDCNCQFNYLCNRK
jgi:alkylated DNA repair dioxygenase AlkB